MIALLDRVFLAAHSFLSALCIYHATAIRLATFLLKSLLLGQGVLVFPCKLPSSFVFLLLKILFITIFCRFNYSMSWHGSVSVDFDGASLCLLDPDVCFLPQFREVFSYYFFKCIFCLLFSLFFFFWDSYNVNVIAFGGVTDFPKSILALRNSFLSLLFRWIPFRSSVF